MSSRHRQSTAQPAASRHSLATPSSTHTANTLPPYKKPSHPLTAAAQQKLHELYSGRQAQVLEKHSDLAAQAITETAVELNDHLRDRADRVERRRRKWERGLHVEEQEREEEELRQLREQADTLTVKLEKGIRDAIDNGEAARRIKDSLKWLGENAHRQMAQEYETQMTQRTQSQSQGPTPGPTPLNQERIALSGLEPMYSNRLERKKDEYYSYSHTARYAKNNAYIGFKGTVHDARYGDEGPPLGRPETWFDEQGAPAPGITAAQTGQDSDDDLIVDKASVSIRCPLTFQKFTNPYTSKKCPHTFEKDAILNYIRGNVHKAVPCPVTGCDQVLTAKDLHVDAVLVRKIKRMIAAEVQGAEDSDSEEEVAVPRQTQSAAPTLKDEPGVRRQSANRGPPRPSQIVDLDDDSDSDDDKE